MTFTTCDRIPIPAPALTDAEIIAGTVHFLETLPGMVHAGAMSNAHITEPAAYCAAYRTIERSFAK